MTIRIFLVFTLVLLPILNFGRVSENISISIASEDVNLIPQGHSLLEYSINPLEDYEFLSYYYDTITRQIVLENGKVVTCKLPLYDIPETKAVTGVKRNLTQEEAENVLIHLKDACTRDNTKEFLWEFCHEKYARQYDDVNTVRRAGKKTFELFFLGFFREEDIASFQKSIKIQTGDYHPERVFFDSDVRRMLPVYPFASVKGHIARIQNLPNSEGITNKRTYLLSLYIPATLINDNTILDPDNTTLKTYNKTLDIKSLFKKIDGKEHIKVSRVAREVIRQALLLLDEPFPVDITTSHATISSHEIKKSKDLLNLEENLYVFKNYLFGAGVFFTDITPETTLFLNTKNRETFNRTVTHVWDDRLLEFDSPITKDAKIMHIPSMDIVGRKEGYKGPSTLWSRRDNKIWIWGQVVTGHNTQFLTEFKKGDIISIAQDSTLNQLQMSRVKEIKSDTVLITEEMNQYIALQGLTSYYIGKRHNDTKTEKSQQEQRVSYMAPELSHINTELPSNIIFIHLQSHSHELFCHPKFTFPKADSWVMRFNIYSLPTKANMMIYLSEDECSKNGISINFRHMKQIIITNYGEKSRFKSTPNPVKVNKTELDFNDVNWWIIYSHGTVRIGYGDELSIQQQLLAFEARIHTKLAYFSFDLDFSFNFAISNLNIYTPTPEMLTTLQIMNRTFETQDDVSYWVSYKNGTNCPAAKKNRSFDVEYKCSKSDRVLEIEEILEPSTCHYHLIVGTNLLCPKTDAVAEHIPEYINKINCIV